MGPLSFPPSLSTLIHRYLPRIFLLIRYSGSHQSIALHSSSFMAGPLRTIILHFHFPHNLNHNTTGYIPITHPSVVAKVP